MPHSSDVLKFPHNNKFYTNNNYRNLCEKSADVHALGERARESIMPLVEFLHRSIITRIQGEDEFARASAACLTSFLSLGRCRRHSRERERTAP